MQPTSETPRPVAYDMTRHLPKFQGEPYFIVVCGSVDTTNNQASEPWVMCQTFHPLVTLMAKPLSAVGYAPHRLTELQALDLLDHARTKPEAWWSMLRGPRPAFGIYKLLPHTLTILRFDTQASIRSPE